MGHEYWREAARELALRRLLAASGEGADFDSRAAHHREQKRTRLALAAAARKEKRAARQSINPNPEERFT
jgi:hypothetical protein